MKWHERLLWFLVGKHVEQRLGRKPAVNIGTYLESGYSVEGDRMERKEKLEAVCKSVVTGDRFKAKGKTTFCNQSVWETAAEMGYDIFRKKQMLAKDIIRHVKSSADWEEASPERACEHAKRGNLAICGKQYSTMDHVSTIYPTEMLFSGSWNKYVPLIANVGKENGIMKVSQAFPVAEGEPQYWILVEGAI